MKSINTIIALLTLIACTPGLAIADEPNVSRFIPTSSIDDTRTLLVFLVSWLQDDLADAHRIYPVGGDVKSITVGDGYGILGEEKYTLGRDGRVIRKESKKNEYSTEDNRRHNVLLSTEYQYDSESGQFEARVHCNGRFFERHVYEINEQLNSVVRYSYYPDGTREPTPTTTFVFEPNTRTLRTKESYLSHDGICDPSWSLPTDPQSTTTTFMFGESGFVTDIISGEDPADKRYLHWRFVPNEDGYLKDTILMPDTHQFRDKVMEYDAFGNPLVIHTYEAVSSFGTVDFEYYGDEEFRREYYGE